MKSITTINPSDESSLNTYEFESLQQVEAKIKLSHEAFCSWRLQSFDFRAQFITNLAVELRSQASDFAQIIHNEMGKPLAQAEAEVLKCATVCDYYAAHAEEILSDSPRKTDHQKSYVSYNPLGVIFAIMPWNFPFWQVLRFAVPTLMAGNSVIVKHSPNVTGCMLAITGLFKKACFPDGLFQHVIADLDLIEPIIKNRFVVGVSLTGSTRAGKSVAQLCGKYLKKCVLELGGSDAYLILEDADIDLSIKKIIQGRLLNSGQSCVSPKRILIPKSLNKEFIEKLKEKITLQVELRPIGPLARKDLRDQLHEQVIASIEGGCQCVIGGEIPEGNGWYYPPTLLTGVQPGTVAFSEELFGPVFSVIEYDSLEQALNWANDSEYGLGGAVFSRNLELAEDIARNKLETGGVFVNDFLKSQPELPFGGIKSSGLGRELSDFGLKEFTNPKTVVVTR